MGGVDLLRIYGLIPARAGNTDATAARKSAIWAHPRSRGEHACATANGYVYAGSSPLARGTQGGAVVLYDALGLIPARAGNTGTGKKVPSPPWAHPRSRGEHWALFQILTDGEGSSPLARGTRERLQRGIIPPGLIPARAGNTLADMGVYPLHQQNRITLEPEPTSRIHDKQLLLTTTSTAILTRLTPP